MEFVIKTGQWHISPFQCPKRRHVRWILSINLPLNALWGKTAIDGTFGALQMLSIVRQIVQIGPATLFQIPLVHFLVLFSTWLVKEEKSTEKYFGYFRPRTFDILCDIVSSCHLSSPAATIYFAILGPNSVPRSFPAIEAALLSLLIVALPPLSPGKRNKEGSQKMRQRRYVGGWNYEIANWATGRITILAPGGDSQFHVDQ